MEKASFPLPGAGAGPNKFIALEFSFYLCGFQGGMDKLSLSMPNWPYRNLKRVVSFPFKKRGLRGV